MVQGEGNVKPMARLCVVGTRNINSGLMYPISFYFCFVVPFKKKKKSTSQDSNSASHDWETEDLTYWHCFDRDSVNMNNKKADNLTMNVKLKNLESKSQV